VSHVHDDSEWDIRIHSFGIYAFTTLSDAVLPGICAASISKGELVQGNLHYDRMLSVRRIVLCLDADSACQTPGSVPYICAGRGPLQLAFREASRRP
jgi:hypothetical protein